MRLRNKKTGEIGEYIPGTGLAFIVRVYAVRSGDTPFVDYQYNSLAELCEKWEDYKEDTLYLEGIQDITWNIAGRVIIDYATGKEAEKAAERLRAWKRLKNRGFKFKGWYSSGDMTNIIRIYAEFPDAKLGPAAALDLNSLFQEGEE